MKKKNLFKCICLHKTPQVRQLDYSSHYLRQVPQDIFNHERTLESLNLDNNNISELTKEVFCCRNLRELILSDNELSQIPEAIEGLSHLTSLNISKNNLQELPQKLGNCQSLEYIDASGNIFEELPEGLCRLAGLHQLIVNTSFLTGLPQNIGKLLNLRHLEVRENEIKALPHNLGQLVHLQHLDVGNNELTELPDSLCRLTELTVLCADKNSIASLPEKIGSCSSLQAVEIQNNCLTFLPDSLCFCRGLQELIVSNNQLHSLPNTIGQLIRLANLRVDNNQLSRLPDSIGHLESLTQLYVSCNQLCQLPQSIGLLRRLRDLHADSNSISELPVEIGSCVALTVLSLRGNRIQYLPDEIGRIPRLKMINLSNNRVKFLPMSFLKLRELQAVWLNDNQIQPLVQLQSERDVDTGRKCLVCYLLPQMSNTEDPTAIENDPSAWQIVQESRPRVVQWNDEATKESMHGRSKLPKDAPAKQVNAKHTIGKHPRSSVNQASSSITIGNGECIMVTASSAMPSSANVPPAMNNMMSWNGDLMYNPNTMPLFYPSVNNGSIGMSRGTQRRIGSGYESDSAAMQASRMRGRIGSNMMGLGGLGQIRETTEGGQGTLLGGSMLGSSTGQSKQGMSASLAATGGAIGFGRHPAGGGMVGGRQSGYNTDTGLLLSSGRRGQQRTGRHRPPQQPKQPHFKNPYDQLRIMRSRDPLNPHMQDPMSANISSLPPPPSRQPPPPPQRPLPSPPYRPQPGGSMEAMGPCPMHLQNSVISDYCRKGYLPVDNCVCGAEDPRTASMIIPPPPCRSPPNLGVQKMSYMEPTPVCQGLVVDLNHPGLKSISPSIIDDMTGQCDTLHGSPMVRPFSQHFSVTIMRDKGLGFSITGGITSNPNPFRPADKGIFIAKVNPGGPADGKLNIGDKILAVNNQSFIGIEHLAAVNILKTCGDVVVMTLDRLCGDEH